jgi:hypothetical protein
MWQACQGTMLVDASGAPGVSAAMYSRSADPGVGPSVVSMSPISVASPVLSEIPVTGIFSAGPDKRNPSRVPIASKVKLGSIMPTAGKLHGGIYGGGAG